MIKNWKLYASTFFAGSITAHFVPLYSIYDFITPLPKPDTPEYIQYQKNLQSKLESLSVYQKLSKNPNFVSRTIQYEENTMENTLSVPGGLSINPTMFVNQDTKECVTIIHAGKKLCGYPLLVHGGVLATLLEENFKNACALIYGVDYKDIQTEKLTMSYKFPTLANSFIVLKCKLSDKIKDSGIFESNLENAEGRLLVSSTIDLKLKKRRNIFNLFGIW